MFAPGGDDTDEFLTRLAWLYFVGGLTQAEVAAQLGITRLRVNRGLAAARARGLARVELDSPFAAALDLQAQLVARFGLRDALIGIATPAAGMPMLHESVVTDGVASMPHAMSIPVPAGKTVDLSPGGYHGMLMGLTAALKEGDSFPVTLTFETAGEVTVDVDVLSMRAEGPDCEHAGQ